MPSSRPRRLFLALLALPILFLFLLYLSSHRTISDHFSTSAHTSKLPDEIFGLLHFVTSPDEADRVISAVGDLDGATLENVNGDGVQLGGAVAPEKPVEMTWYALGSIAKASERERAGAGRGPAAAARLASVSASGGWDDRLRTLREEYPLVVFSKSYCPYSKRAKKLLEMYDLFPAPKIIEVDLRADAPHVKTLLRRLTYHSTFPNVILHGRSLGGSDDLIRLHEEDRLRQMLVTAGVKVKWTGEGGEDVLV